MNTVLKKITQFLSRGFSLLTKHIYAVLFIFFLSILAFAGFIFWHYGYQVSLLEPEITIDAVTPKEKELRMLIEKMEKSDTIRESILEKIVTDPFANPEESLP